MTLGTKLRKHRERKRYSQKEVAELLSISQTTYYNWENDISSFRVDYLPRLAQLFEINIIELISAEIANHQSQPTDTVDLMPEDSRELYADLLKSKDEIIQLLKEENTQLRALLNP